MFDYALLVTVTLGPLPGPVKKINEIMKRKKKYPFLCSWASSITVGEATPNPRTEWIVHNRIIIAGSAAEIREEYSGLTIQDITLLPFDYEILKSKKPVVK